MEATPHFRVLGPVRADAAGEPLPTGSPQQRALLSALLLRPGRSATAAELIDALWGEAPPPQALAAIRTYVSRLRKALGAGVLVSESGGYTVRLPGPAADHLDLAAAEAWWSQAERARERGDRCGARVLVNRALALWEGEPLAGVPGPYAAARRARLEEWRLQLLEARLEMDLDVGCHADTVAELTALIADHPLRERLRELQMLALYRSGRQAEALGVYADTRRLLAEELGVEPGPALADLQRRVLQGDPVLSMRPSSDDGAADRGADGEQPVPACSAGSGTGSGADTGAGAGPPSALPRIPSQLPHPVGDFTGRQALVAELDRVLSAARTKGHGVPVAVLTGIGGVGKSTLALRVAHEARPHFPDGQLYADLDAPGSWRPPGETDPPGSPYPDPPGSPLTAAPRGPGARPAGDGRDPAVPPRTATARVLDAFLRALGVPGDALPAHASLAERAALYRSALAGRRVLVVLDHAHDAALVRPLLPATEGCAALVTGRTRMPGLAGAHPLDLDVFCPEEALRLFTRIVGEERVRNERQAALDTVTACGFLPLAVRVAGARLAARPTWTLSVLAAKLADENRRLEELRTGDLSVEAVLARGHDRLTPSQARAFRLLGRGAGRDVPLSTAAVTLGLPRAATEALLESLVDVSLLESAAPGHYRYHPLVRLYARACAARAPETERKPGREPGRDRDERRTAGRGLLLTRRP